MLTTYNQNNKSLGFKRGKRIIKTLNRVEGRFSWFYQQLSPNGPYAPFSVTHLW